MTLARSFNKILPKCKRLTMKMTINYPWFLATQEVHATKVYVNYGNFYSQERFFDNHLNFVK